MTVSPAQRSSSSRSALLRTLQFRPAAYRTQFGVVIQQLFEMCGPVVRVGRTHHTTVQRISRNSMSLCILDFPKRRILVSRSIFPRCLIDRPSEALYRPVRKNPNTWSCQKCHSDKIMAEFVSERVYQTRAQMNSGKLDETEKFPMLHRLLDYNKDARPVTRMGHMSDTISTTLPRNHGRFSRHSQFKTCRISTRSTRKVYKFTLRPQAFLNVSCPRPFPVLEPNASISWASRCSQEPSPLLRPSQLFSRLLPDHWRDDDTVSAKYLAVMNQHFMPLGVGSRVSGGHNLVQAMRKVVVTAVERDCNIEACVEMNKRNSDGFVIFPLATACTLIFDQEHLDQASKFFRPYTSYTLSLSILTFIAIVVASNTFYLVLFDAHAYASMPYWNRNIWEGEKGDARKEKDAKDITEVQTRTQGGACCWKAKRDVKVAVSHPSEDSSASSTSSASSDADTSTGVEGDAEESVTSEEEEALRLRARVGRHTLQAHLDCLAAWCKRNFLYVNAGKSWIMVFGRPRNIPDPLPRLTLDGKPVPYTTEHTYVGITINSAESNMFAQHCRNDDCNAVHMTSAARRTGNALFSIERVIGSLPPVEGRMLYNARIDPYFISGADVILDISPTLVEDMYSVQLSLLRRLLGINAQSMTAPLFTELGLLPLHFRRVTMALRLLRELLDSPESELAKLTLDVCVDLHSGKHGSWLGDIQWAIDHLPRPLGMDDVPEILKLPPDVRTYSAIQVDEMIKEVTHIAKTGLQLQIDSSDERLCRLCGSSIESPEHAILLCEGDPDLVALRNAALTLLAPSLPHLDLLCPIDPDRALDILRGLIFQDICLPPVAKLVYEVMELFKSFELERPRHDKPLPVLRTWHRRVPGCTPTRARQANPPMESDSDSDSDYIP
ncbi:hypothetical protein BDZ89DRAFT_1129597 [Hymenopellis radicata]|nr:hypothetical protein BDZ89DRAFT_1129597 [Hymenopellis radicata]